MKDLAGKRFHCLTVIQFARKDSYSNVVWECKCECGKTTHATGYSLTNGTKKSCGHLRKDYLRNFRTETKKAHIRVRDENGTGIDDALDELGALV
jgi:hypothetical protein